MRKDFVWKQKKEKVNKHPREKELALSPALNLGLISSKEV